MSVPGYQAVGRRKVGLQAVGHGTVGRQTVGCRAVVRLTDTAFITSFETYHRTFEEISSIISKESEISSSI